MFYSVYWQSMIFKRCSVGTNRAKLLQSNYSILHTLVVMRGYLNYCSVAVLFK